MHGVLRAGIWCAITPFSPLFVVVLHLGTLSLDPLRDLTHGSLCDPTRGLSRVIFSRYRVLGIVISDGGSHFTDRTF
jgi:hypothetical protein